MKDDILSTTAVSLEKSKILFSTLNTYENEQGIILNEFDISSDNLSDKNPTTEDGLSKLNSEVIPLLKSINLQKYPQYETTTLIIATHSEVLEDDSSLSGRTTVDNDEFSTHPINPIMETTTMINIQNEIDSQYSINQQVLLTNVSLENKFLSDHRNVTSDFRDFQNNVQLKANESSNNLSAISTSIPVETSLDTTIKRLHGDNDILLADISKNITFSPEMNFSLNNFSEDLFTSNTFPMQLQTSIPQTISERKITTIKSIEQDLKSKFEIESVTHVLKPHTVNSHLSTVTKSSTILTDIKTPYDNVVENTTVHNIKNFDKNAGISNLADKVTKPILKVTHQTDYTNLKITGDLNANANENANGRLSSHSSNHQHIRTKTVVTSKVIGNDGKFINYDKTGIETHSENNLDTNFDFSSAAFLIGITATVILIIFIFISLWYLKRSKYHTKVYLSYELARPRTLITKPMRPSILPEENLIDNSEILTPATENPREPTYFNEELCENLVISQLHSKYSVSTESCDSGIDNLAFTDGSSTEGVKCKKTNSFPKRVNPKGRRPIPRYISRIKKASMENSLKVCSSDGSIFPTSPSLTKCLIPAPPYSPSKRNNNKFTLPNCHTTRKDSIVSISEVCEIPSQSSINH